MTRKTNLTRITEIWRSFRALPLWVQIWVALVLLPVNLFSLAFVDQHNGLLIALLAVGGMAPNIVIMLAERGLSRLMALPHVLIWTPLIVIVWQTLGTASQGYAGFLWLLLAVDLCSLAFDYLDVLKWWRGARTVAGK